MAYSYMNIFFRTIFAFLILFLIARTLGKQMISNMTFHDFISGITLGALAANLAFNEKIPSLHVILSLIVFSVIAYLMSILALKSRKWRKWVSGAPTILIQNGKVLEGNLKKLRYTMDSLNQSLREKSIFDIEAVEYAVLEDFGKLSVKKKEAYEYVTKKDLNILVNAKISFPVELIMDGKVIEDNLNKYGMSTKWLEAELAKQGKTAAEVFYAVRGTQNQLVFDYYRDDINKPID